MVHSERKGIELPELQRGEHQSSNCADVLLHTHELWEAEVYLVGQVSGIRRAAITVPYHLLGLWVACPCKASMY